MPTSNKDEYLVDEFSNNNCIVLPNIYLCVRFCLIRVNVVRARARVSATGRVKCPLKSC